MTDIASLTARIDKLQYNEVVDFFAEVGDVWFLGGTCKGKAGPHPVTGRPIVADSSRARQEYQNA